MAAPTRVATPISASAPPASPVYRTDLDGLRGIAIMLVACFHIWFGRVSGGVDVFLTLSGYFFIGSLLRHSLHSQSPAVGMVDAVNPWPRFKRLVRRLLPALFTLLLAVTVLTLVVIPQTRWVNIGRELIASGLYYQNWYLAENSQDYLAASSANSPLQHLWSMSVQGQFFVGMLLLALIFTGLVKLIARVYPPIARPAVMKALIALALIGVAIISFYWAHMRMGVNQQWNYFDTLSRLWELLAGGLLAIWLPKWQAPAWLRNLLGAIALALIITCGWWISGVDSYPGPLALVPALSTLVLIWSGAGALRRTATAAHRKQSETEPELPMMNRALASRVPVWLGSFSYALYLWHWPLLIFYLTWRAKDHASFLDGLGLIVLSLVLSWLTKRYVEDPLRSGDRSKLTAGTRAGRARWLNYASVATTVLVVLSVVAGVGVKVWEHHVSTIVVDTANLDPREYPGARALLDNAPVPALDPQPSALTVTKDFPETSTDGFMSSFTDPDIHVGVYGDRNATRTVALAGGSHAEYWITALNLLGLRNHFKVTTYLKMGCPLSTEAVPEEMGVPYPQCHDWVERTMDRIGVDKPDAVFTTATRPNDHAPGDWTPPDYTPIFDRFMGAGIPVLGMRDTPWPMNGKGAIDTPTCLADGGNARTCGSARARVLSPTNPAQAYADDKPMFHPLDLDDGICDAQMCPAVVGNIIVYKDWHHLSATYVRSLTDHLGAQMAAALPWTGPGAR